MRSVFFESPPHVEWAEKLRRALRKYAYVKLRISEASYAV